MTNIPHCWFPLWVDLAVVSEPMWSIILSDTTTDLRLVKQLPLLLPPRVGSSQSEIIYLLWFYPFYKVFYAFLWGSLPTLYSPVHHFQTKEKKKKILNINI